MPSKFMRNKVMRSKFLLLIPLAVSSLYSQEKQEEPGTQAIMMQILQRLDSLEQQNAKLVEEVRVLEQELAVSHAPPASAAASQEQPPVEEQVAVNARRIEEQAQTKVEASQKFPLWIDGMLLFNAFTNSGAPGVGGAANYALLTGPGTSGATVRQTLLGLQFQGPSIAFGGQVHGSLMMDFGAGYPEPGASWLRLRQADLSLDWKNRSFSVGQEQPLISPYQPDSLAEVTVPPLAQSGNLWLWLPQARYEERVHFGANSGLTAQAAVLQTGENYQNVPDEYAYSLALARPALEGRFAFWHKFDDVRRFEIGSGFHVSTTHVAGASVDSRIASLDWRIVPSSKIQITGTAFHGQNVAGLGSIGNGFAILENGTVRPVPSSGGWTQLSVSLTKRLNLNLFGGVESDQGKDLAAENIVRNLTYASNLMYHLGPNVIVSVEGLQMRTRLASGTTEIHNHYDLALAYLF